MSVSEIPNYGVDVASQRTDDLDKLMLQDVAASLVQRFVDIGAGAGGQSGRLVAAGATVQAIDIFDYTDVFHSLRTALGVSARQLTFTPGDIIDVLSDIPVASYDAICLQRTIHYLPYQKACQLLSYLAAGSTSRLYISATGYDSAIGMVHPQRHENINTRFAKLDAKSADTFRITAPLCVYTESELRTLLSMTGWNIERFWVSAFGNLKAVATAN